MSDTFSNKPRRLVVYELNEVPWRVVDEYVKRKPDSNLAFLLKKSDQLTTHTVDIGELHPWSTWPTMHRGVSNEVHKIRFINQDLSHAESYPPIWEILDKKGISYGIFGALQSYKTNWKSGNSAFFVPDTFAPGPECKPPYLNKFQRFNLSMTSENKAVASTLSVNDFLGFLSLLPLLSVRTLYSIFRHVLMEIIQPLYKSRRSLHQATVSFDLFFKELKKTKPNYASYFSNHCAGAMHRYWRYLFPDDFVADSGESKKFINFHKNSVMEAMNIFDHQLGDLIDFALSNKYEVAVSSSMGQEAIVRKPLEKEPILINAHRLVELILGKSEAESIQVNLAMQPDIAVEFKSQDSLQKFKSEVLRILNTSSIPLFRIPYPSVGLTLNFAINYDCLLSNDSELLFGDLSLRPDDIGLDFIVRDVGTAYHQPKGIFLLSNFHDPSKQNNSSRTEIDSREYLGRLLAFLGLKT